VPEPIIPLPDTNATDKDGFLKDLEHLGPPPATKERIDLTADVNHFFEPGPERESKKGHLTKTRVCKTCRYVTFIT
jgi:hypothetical protein